MDDDTSGSGHAVHHGSDLYRETHKDAVDKGEIGTSKSSLDGDEIKNYIRKCFAETMAELVTLISKIPVEVVKALKNEQNKQSQEDKIDEQQQSQEDGSNKQERQHKSDMQDVNAADKDAGREDNFEKEDCSDLQALEDVNLTAKEDVTEVNLKNQKSTDVTDVQDEVGGTITDSIQLAIDTILFGLSTPLTTKSLDVGASNKMTERHWDFPVSQISPDWELQASKEKAPAKRERKKSRVLRSPYISKYSSGSKDAVDIDKEEKLKYVFDGYNINQYLPNELMIDYSQWIVVGLLKTHSAKKETDNHYRVNASGLGFRQLDFVVAYPQSKNWFYLMSERKTCWNDEGFCMPAGLPWYMVDEIYVLINCDNDFYDKTERTDWPSLEAYKGKITQQTGLVNEIPFDVDYVQNIPQQASDSLDCGVFVCVYAEILSEELQVHSYGFDFACQRARYASLLWHYGLKKVNKGYTSDNGDPLRPRKSVIEEIEAKTIVTLE
ncbi:hypothetical protein T459_29145 [Capsicum annuum]|uniref:Ubiquitin-like protease family profile domain-containing protein n=1 Tax=Capsicum annuum TaxID=4072 RepID=A0A2G2Y4R8_CAPAN|nr:hypothetical protein T459_29145 [Capsicum annuum]